MCNYQHFGKYKYLPMGIKYATDFAQQSMEQVLHGLDNVEVYIDDIVIYGTTWGEHQILLDKVLSCLAANGFIHNPIKCAWAILETNWLGYWSMSTGLKPWKKHISAILEKESPHNLKEMHGFLGSINTHWLMWPKQAHLLTPLSEKSGKTFCWTLEIIPLKS